MIIREPFQKLKMKNANGIIKFGENVEGYRVPVLNEREIRAAAGIMFLALSSAYVIILFKEDFLYVKYVIVLFFVDFIIRVFISPRFSPVLIIGRLIVSNQIPEYVGAPQKKFAWKIGVALSGLMFFLLIILNSVSIITVTSCVICLVFLFFESAFGICLGCLVYNWFYKKEALYCSGDACEIKTKHSIQKISVAQILVVLGTTMFILLAIVLFNDQFRAAPKDLREIITSLTRI